MKRVVIPDNRPIYPFNEPARELRVMNKPLKIHQRDMLVRYCDSLIEYSSFDRISPADKSEMIVYQDNVFFDQPFIDTFIAKARARDRACRVAFSKDDLAITRHAIYLQDDIHLEGDVYVGNLWYFPRGVEDDPEFLIIDTMPVEMGHYHVPTYMASETGESVYYVPLRAFLSIENWYHIFIANTPFGVWSIGGRFEAEARKLSTNLKLFFRGMWERKQVLSTSKMVVVGKNVHINPTARILGPAFIGDNCYIGHGVVIQNSIIGNNVNLEQGVQVMLSVISDNCFLPFRAAIYLSTLMERCVVAQNACLQMCVIGRGTFIGAGTTFTDFHLVPKPVRTMHKNEIESTGSTVLGCCVGHNCRIGAGLVFMPGRIVESDTILARSDKRAIVVRNVSYEQSDHHVWPESYSSLHRPLYRPGQE
jgi:carbonic anhydrase/acetyltransferase-like protein (isoleucine patch superfamily)